MTGSKSTFLAIVAAVILTGCATTQGEIDLNNLKDGDLLFRQDDIEAKFDEMRSDNDALQTKISALDAEIEDQNSKIAIAQRTLSQASADEQTASQDVINLGNDLSQLQVQLATKQRVIKATLKEIARLDKLILEKNSLSKAQKIEHAKAQIALEDELASEQLAFEKIKEAIDDKSNEAVRPRSNYRPVS